MSDQPPREPAAAEPPRIIVCYECGRPFPVPPDRPFPIYFQGREVRVFCPDCVQKLESQGRLNGS